MLNESKRQFTLKGNLHDLWHSAANPEKYLIFCKPVLGKRTFANQSDAVD